MHGNEAQTENQISCYQFTVNFALTLFWKVATDNKTKVCLKTFEKLYDFYPIQLWRGLARFFVLILKKARNTIHTLLDQQEILIMHPVRMCYARNLIFIFIMFNFYKTCHSALPFAFYYYLLIRLTQFDKRFIILSRNYEGK